LAQNAGPAVALTSINGAEAPHAHAALCGREDRINHDAACVLAVATLSIAEAAERNLDADCLDCHHPGHAFGGVAVIEGQHAAYL
jgi:hypothetical protein